MTIADAHGSGEARAHDDPPTLEAIEMGGSASVGPATNEHTWSLNDAADATLVVAASGLIVFANDQAGALFGAAPDALVGTSVDGLLPERARATHRTHQTRYQAEPSDRTIGTGLDVWARRADGTEVPVEISLASRTFDGVVLTVAAVRNISDRADANHHHRRVLQMLDATDDAVFIFDAATLKYSYVNDGAVRLVGYSRDELLKMTPLHLNPYDSETDYHELVGGLLADGTASVVRQATLLCKDGTEAVVEKTLRIAAIGGDGVHAVIAMARDITARQAAEGELRMSKGALFIANRVLAHDRERIAADLHDIVSERLFGEGLNLQVALAELGVGDAQGTRNRIQATIDGLDQAIREMRMAIFALEAEGAAPGGLRVSLLRELVAATDERNIQAHLEFDGPIETVDEVSGRKLTSALRDVLADVVHDDHADNVRVEVRVTDQIVLTVVVSVAVMGGPEALVPKDAPPAYASRPSRPSTMTRHAKELGGVVTKVSAPTGGTTVVWQIPICAAGPDA